MSDAAEITRIAAVGIAGLTLGAGLSLLLPGGIFFALGLVLLPLAVFLHLIARRRRINRETMLLSRSIEEAVHQERERIYRNLHDDLGAQLLSLVYQAPDAKMADQARVALQSLREDIARTLDKRLTLLELLGDLRSEMESRLEANGIDLVWDVPLDMVDSPVQVQNVIGISRILREAVSNVIKHASATEVRFSVSSSDSSIEITIRDNGKGIMGNLTAGRGLESMTSRAQELGAALTVEDTEAGCQVGLMLPR